MGKHRRPLYPVYYFEAALDQEYGFILLVDVDFSLFPVECFFPGCENSFSKIDLFPFSLPPGFNYFCSVLFYVQDKSSLAISMMSLLLTAGYLRIFFLVLTAVHGI